MAIKTYNDQNFVAIANAIRAKNGETTQYKPSEMAAAISAIESAIEVLPQDTVSGAIANFPDGSDGYPVVELIANIDPKQAGSGDPSPSNVRPISGYTGMSLRQVGANWWSEEWELGIWNGSGSKQDTNNAIRCKDYIHVLPNTTYYLKLDTSVYVSGLIVRLMDKEKNVVRTITVKNTPTFTTDSNVEYIVLCSATADVITTYNNNISLNYPATDTSYHRYVNSKEISISWESEAGTVYGGTLNVTTGELTVKKVGRYLSSLTWVNNASFASTFNGSGFTERKKNISFDSECYCDTYKGYSSSQVGLEENGIALATGSYATVVYVKDSRYATAQEFTNALAQNDVLVVVPIETPQVYQLTPEQVKTLLGVNNIYADTGNVEVTYRADIDLYIAKKIAEGA